MSSEKQHKGRPPAAELFLPISPKKQHNGRLPVSASHLPIPSKEQHKSRPSTAAGWPLRRPSYSISASPIRPYGDSPLRPSFTIPFSWEKLPGVPKFGMKTGLHENPHNLPLPLPPPPTSSTMLKPRYKNGSMTPDPFTVALEKCAGRRSRSTTGGGRRQATWVAIAERLRVVLGLHGSCKNVLAVLKSAVRIRRPSIRARFSTAFISK